MWRQQQNETRSNLLRGRTERIDFSRGGERVTRAEVSELIHSFPQALRLFLRQRPDEEFDLHQIEQVLQDCVDLIRETAEAGRTSVSATLEDSITAFVACATVSTTSASTFQGSHRTKDDEESRTIPSAFPARTACAKRQAPMFRNGDEEQQEKRPVCSLPQPSSTMTRIDLKTDSRVFAVLDDGCNRTCHTPALLTTCVLYWRARARSCHRLSAKPDTTQALEDAEPQVDEAFPSDWRFPTVLRCVQS